MCRGHILHAAHSPLDGLQEFFAGEGLGQETCRLGLFQALGQIQILKGSDEYDR